ARSFHERRNRVGAADHHLLSKLVGCPCEAYPRLKILLVRLIQRSAGAVLPGQLQHPAEGAEVGLPIFHLDQRRMVFPTQAEIQRQGVIDTPVILEIEAVNGLAMTPRARAQATTEAVRKPQHEIRLTPRP